MDTKKELRAFLCAPPWKMVLCTVLAAAAVFFGVMSFSDGDDDKSSASLYYPGVPAGTYGYVDVIAVSDWLCKSDDAVFYTAFDSEGGYCTVRLFDAEFADMTEQQEYFLSDEVLENPEVHRVYGVVETIDSEVADILAQCWEISSTEYYNSFGGTYLNAATSPGSERSSLWLLAFAAAVAAALVLGLSAGSVNRCARKSIKRLEDTGRLDVAADELASPMSEMFDKGRVRAGSSFLFSASSGAAVSYDDILWAFKRITRYNLVKTGVGLVLGTRTMKQVTAVTLGPKSDPDIDRLIEEIAARNPAAMIGYTGENAVAYRTAVNAKEN